MKAKDVAYLVVIGVLLGLLASECTKRKPIERIVVQEVNLDSLKATLPPDTVIVPGPARQVVRYVTVTVTSQAQADSLAREYAALAQQFSDMQTQTQWGWLQGEGQFPFEVEEPEHVYSDSITTADYFHRWDIRAQGSIKSYSYAVIPICPTLSSPPAKAKKPARHRIGAYWGGQTSASVTRSVYAVKYSRGWASVQGGYLPAHNGQPDAAQLLIGLEIPIR